MTLRFTGKHSISYINIQYITTTMSAMPHPEHEFFTISDLSLSRALNSLLPPSLKAAKIHSFKPKPELETGISGGEDGSMTSLQLFNATHLPPRETIKRLATRLNTSLGITFFIVESSAEVENLIDKVYSHCDYYNSARQKHRADNATGGDACGVEQLPQPPATSEICEILAMAAVGSQYHRQASASLRQACFHSARFGIDDAIEEAEEADAGDDACYRVLRLLTLLAIYQILEKRGSCWRYIGTALTIAKARNLDRYDGETASSGEGYPESLHVRMRKLWGTLVCLESWIGATLGKPPTTTINLTVRISIGDPVFCYREDNSYAVLHSAEGSLPTRSLQVALVRIAILTAAIQRSIYPFSSYSGKANKKEELALVRSHMAALTQWFETLPPSLHLSALLRENTSTLAADRAVTFAERSSMLLAHCLYLSAVMLLTRRNFLSVVSDPSGGYDILLHRGDRTNLALEKQEALDYVCSSLTAANATGRIMGLMVSEDRLVSKCWLAIYPSFNACLLLLFHLTQRKLLCGETAEGSTSAPGIGQLRGKDDADTVETTENAKKCLAALEFCASGGDALSNWYLQVLAPFRKVLGETVERVTQSNEGSQGNMGQPGIALCSRPEAYSATGGAVNTSTGAMPTTTRPHLAFTGSSVTPSATTNTADDPAALSSHMYNILAVSAQCAFRPEEASFTEVEYPGSDSWNVHEYPSASSSSAIPLSSLPSAPPGVEVPPNTLYSPRVHVSSQTRPGTLRQEYGGGRDPLLEPGEELNRGAKRMKMAPCPP
ncbi:hypothetical protein EV426DRAFT_3881 [Tirmania nivea]|nr:hypothetical protein EV426DRAFT_3881 [Tirmania nivea]